MHGFRRVNLRIIEADSRRLDNGADSQVHIHSRAS
jgi:hypothetical protein